MKLPEFKEKMHDLGYMSKIIDINPDYDLVFVKVIEEGEGYKIFHYVTIDDDIMSGPDDHIGGFVLELIKRYENGQEREPESWYVNIDRFIREPNIIEKHQKRRNFE